MHPVDKLRVVTAINEAIVQIKHLEEILYRNDLPGGFISSPDTLRLLEKAKQLMEEYQ